MSGFEGERRDQRASVPLRQIRVLPAGLCDVLRHFCPALLHGWPDDARTYSRVEKSLAMLISFIAPPCTLAAPPIATLPERFRSVGCNDDGKDDPSVAIWLQPASCDLHRVELR